MSLQRLIQVWELSTDPGRRQIAKVLQTIRDEFGDVSDEGIEMHPSAECSIRREPGDKIHKNPVEFGKRLREYIHLSRIKIKDLALVMSVDVHSIYAWERGEYVPPTSIKMLNLIDVLKIPDNELEVFLELAGFTLHSMQLERERRLKAEAEDELIIQRDPKAWGATVWRYRQLTNFTQEELGKLLNLSRGAINNYEQGNSIPQIHIVIDLAEFLGVPRARERQFFALAGYPMDAVRKAKDQRRQISY